MRRTLFWILISLVTFAFGVATSFVWLNPARPIDTSMSSQQSESLTQHPILAYCELANNPEKYDGKVVRVSTRLWFMMHGYSFMSRNCDGETKQTAVIFPNGRGSEFETKISEGTGLEKYHPWGFPEVIVVGRFRRVEPSRKSDSMEDNTYLHFEVLEVEKASEY